MSDTTPNGPAEPAEPAEAAEPTAPAEPAAFEAEAPEPVAAPAGYESAPPPAYAAPAYAAPAYDPVASAAASSDPMPLEVSDRDSRNWMGIVALITGIIGISIAAIVFGILGLNAVKNGKATNKVSNIVGIVLGAVWVVIGIIASIAFFAWVADKVEDAAPEVGDCYVSTIESTDTLEDFNPTFGECTTATNAEVYYITTYSGDSAPGDDGFTDEMFNLCTTETAVSNVDTDLAAEYFVEYYLPSSTPTDWGVSKTVVCSLSGDAGPIPDDLIVE